MKRKHQYNYEVWVGGMTSTGPHIGDSEYKEKFLRAYGTMKDAKEYAESCSFAWGTAKIKRVKVDPNEE